MRYFFSILALSLASIGFSQPAQVQVNADCVIAFNITTSGGTAGSFDNRRIGCNSWQISYANNGFSAITLAVQSAPDSSGTPGAFGTIGGTLTFGVNPNTNTTGASSLIQSYGTNFGPWIRVALTSATGSGSVVGILLGYRAAGSAGTSGGSASNVTVTGPLGEQATAASVSVAIANNQTAGSSSLPVQGAGADGAALAGNLERVGFSDGANAHNALSCNNAKPTITNLSGSGNTVIFTGTAAQNIYICDIEFSTGTPEDFKLTEGTTAACAAGTADASALMKNISAWSLTPAGGLASLITQTAGDSLCANQANAQAAAITVWAIKF